MPKQKRNILVISSLFFLLLSIADSFSEAFSWQIAKQWIKVSAAKHIAYEFEVVDLKSSVIKTSDEGQVIELSTTPFSNQGKIILKVNLSHCVLTNLHQVIIPFESTPNKTIYTPAQNYPIVVDSNCYSGVKESPVVINITVTGAPFDGYTISIH